MIEEKDRLDYLEALVLGTPEALELFSHYRDLILTTKHEPTEYDPHNENAKLDMAKAEVYQYFINFNNQLKREGENNERTSTGQPTV